jgi:hypothetical protein
MSEKLLTLTIFFKFSSQIICSNLLRNSLKYSQEFKPELDSTENAKLKLVGNKSNQYF